MTVKELEQLAIFGGQPAIREPLHESCPQVTQDLSEGSADRLRQLAPHGAIEIE